MTNKVGLYQKMLAVYKAVDYLQKDDQVSYKNTNYKAISEEKVTSAVRKALVENNLIVFPIEQEHKKDGNLTTVNVKYKIVDCETGEYEILVSSGTGVDTQDKGVGKAMTYAFKYLFLRTFAIPTGEDPDKISSAELDDQERMRKENEDKKILTDIKTKWQALAGNLDGFDEFYAAQKNRGVSDQRILEVLTKRLLEKAKGEKSA